MEMQKDLLTALVQGLALLEKALRNPARTDFDSDNVARLYYVALSDVPHVSPSAVRRACEEILKREDLVPTPATLRRYVVDHANRLYYEALSDLMRGWVSCVDENGYLCVAPPTRVRAGVLLPPGDESGDGSPAPLPLEQPKKSSRAKVERVLGSGNRNVRSSGLRKVSG